ncbi:MAG: MarR family transcriptional regulator [Chloroflexi bacterium]|nr:MarR family transcriptional regulator [Chloroflexota bacterium]
MTDLELVRQEGMKIDNMLCFALYAASRTAVESYRPFLDKLDLTYPQYLTLLLLWEREPRTVKEIGQALYLDSGTLSPLLKRLEKKGLISRQRDTGDERQVNITLTEAGWAMKEQVRDLPETLFCQIGWPIEDFASLIERLHSLTGRILDSQSKN